MANRSSQAGGSLLALSILGGFLLGVALGDPFLGAVIGTAIGLLLAATIWLMNRRR